MKSKSYLLISAIIFALVAILHLVRLIGHWSVQIGAFAIPLWGSWLGLFIATALSLWAFRLMTERRGSYH
jgi:hypothetical protein